MLQDEGSVQVLQDLRQRQMRLQLMGMMGEETADSRAGVGRHLYGFKPESYSG